MKIERSFDYALLAAIGNEPSVYKMSADDYSPIRGAWKPIESQQIVYLVAHEKNNLLGFCAFVPENQVCFVAHILFLPVAYGSRSRRAFAAMLEWMWENTVAERIVGQIPVFNRLAIQFAKECGCREMGINPRSWKKGGHLHDRVMLGISRQ